MDKEKGFLSGVRKRLSGKEKWEPDEDPFKGGELDDDMAVLALDDTPKKPAGDRGITLELSGYGADPEEKPDEKPAEKPAEPAISLELPKMPEIPVPEMPVMPEISLELPEDLPEPPAEEEPAAPEAVSAPEPAESEAAPAKPLVEDMDRWDMPESEPDPERWDMPEEELPPEEEEALSPFDKLKGLFAGRKKEAAEDGGAPEEKPGLGGLFPRKKKEEGAEEAVPEAAEEPLQPEEASPAEEPLPEDEELEPEVGEENAGAAIRQSAGKMASGVGRGLLSILMFLWGFISEAFLTFGRTTWEHIRNETKPRNWKHLFSRYLLTLVIIYYEIVFKLSTKREPWGFALVYIILFSICWGLLGYLLTTFLKPKTNRQIRRVLIPLLAVPFIVNYFKYQRMGRLYGLNDTVPVTTNSTAMLRLIFSPAGLFHILLFLLPFVLYLLLVIHVDAARRIKARRRIRTVLSILALWFFTWLLVLINGNYRWDYGREYTYQAAAADFGLMTAMRLDVQNKLGLTRKNNNPPLIMPTEETVLPAETEGLTEDAGESAASPESGGGGETESGTPELEEPQAASR